MTPATELTLFIIITLFGCILSLLGLAWQTNSMNISSVLLSSWLLIGCLVFFVNSLAMNAKIWCDISTKLMVGAYVGVPPSMVCVLHRLYMTITSPDSQPDKRLYHLLCKLALMLGMPALIIVVHIIVQDRRYIFIEQAGCIPSISPSLFPLIAVLVWPLLFNIASLAYLGLAIYSICLPRRQQRGIPAPPETLTLYHFLKIYISLFIGVVCTSSVSLFLLVWITNNSHISIDSLHHDFQTIHVFTVDQWSRDPQLRAAIELRWLWAFSSIVLAVGLFPNERAKQIFGLLISAKLCIRTRTWHRPASNVVCHGSLPVYISQSSISFHSEAPAIPPLVRQSTLAPTFRSRATSVESRQPEVFPQTPEPDARSSSSQPCDTETIRPIPPSEPSELPQLSRSSQRTERVVEPAASVLTLVDSIYPASSFGGASSTYQTCEEGSVRR